MNRMTVPALLVASLALRHTPLSGDRKIDHLLTTSIFSRTRVDAGCHNNRIAGRWVTVLLDILFPTVIPWPRISAHVPRDVARGG
jgi:hypothetical protein